MTAAVIALVASTLTIGSGRDALGGLPTRFERQRARSLDVREVRVRDRGGSIVSVVAADPQSSPTPARPADVGSQDSIIAALYDVISGPGGQKRDWDRFRSLFAPGARLIPTGQRPDGTGTVRVLTPDEYASGIGPRLEASGFFERETARTSDAFGHIVQAFSTYESRHAAGDPQPFARGINSIQLVNDGTRWWVMTVLWDSERPGTPIPAKYLGKSGS